MSLSVEQVRVFIVRPVCKFLELWSEAAEEQLMGTAAQESHFSYVDQLDRGGQYVLGPALGLWQMEPVTELDIFNNFLKYKPALKVKVERLAGKWIPQCPPLLGDLHYQAALARIHYYRVKENLPAAHDLAGQAAYWKRYYNTFAGKGTVEEYIENYKRFIKGPAH